MSAEERRQHLKALNPGYVIFVWCTERQRYGIFGTDIDALFIGPGAFHLYAPVDVNRARKRGYWLTVTIVDTIKAWMRKRRIPHYVERVRPARGHGYSNDYVGKYVI